MKKAGLVLVVVSAMVMVAGCVTTPEGPTDEELIQQTLDQFSAAIIEKDIDKLGAILSEKFSAPEGESKQDFLDFMQSAIDSGYLDDAEVSREDAQQTMGEGTCDVYPVDLMSSAGSVSVELHLTKEDGGWLITSLDVDGM